MNPIANFRKLSALIYQVLASGDEIRNNVCVAYNYSVPCYRCGSIINGCIDYITMISLRISSSPSICLHTDCFTTNALWCASISKWLLLARLWSLHIFLLIPDIRNIIAELLIANPDTLCVYRFMASQECKLTFFVM